MSTDRKPHKWAEVIHAFADGRAVQVRYFGCEGWADTPTLEGVNALSFEWRIKPEPATLRYRVGLFKDGRAYYIGTANTPTSQDLFERSTNFVEWLSDWATVEIPE